MISVQEARERVRFIQELARRGVGIAPEAMSALAEVVSALVDENDRLASEVAALRQALYATTQPSR